jgi:hypothetical protein
MFTLSLEGFRSSTTPSRIYSHPPQLLSRLPRRAQRVVGLAPLPSIPFGITSFADHYHLTPIESNSYKNQGGRGRPSLPSAQSPSAYMQETPQPFSFHVATHSFVHTGGWGYPPSPRHLTAHRSPQPGRGVGVCPKRLWLCVHERNATNPLPSIHYALSPCTTGWGVPLFSARLQRTGRGPLLDTGLVFGSGRGTRATRHVSHQMQMEQIPSPNVSTGAEVNSDA